MAKSKHRGRLSRTARVTLWLVGGLVVVAGASYGVGYALAADNLPKNTVISGVPVGSLPPDQAEQKLRTELAKREAARITVKAETASITTTGAQAGLGVDYAASIAHAGGGRTYDPLAIVNVLFGGLSQEAVVTVDSAKLDAVVASLAEQVDVAPVDAQLAYDGLTPKVTPGEDGRALQRAETADAIRDAFLDKTTVTAPVAPAEPEITTDDAEATAKTLAISAVSDDITVTVADHGTITIAPKQIAAVLSFSDQGGELVPSVDGPALAAKLNKQLDKLGLKQPKDARFTIKRGSKPKIVASQDGVGVDAEALGEVLVPVLGKTSDRTAAVDVAPRPAAFTTKDAKALGVKEVIGEFTTYFPGSAYRYNNIGKAAKLINGTFLKPGEVFSMNATLGKRTRAAGWMAGGAIDGGRIVERLGGGISQATTTTFNAVFFAGLKDIYHKPHSLYFSRYPVGREATLDWDSVDMKFENDSDYGVLMEAWITGSSGRQGSITVRVWSTKRYTIKSSTPVRSNYRAPGKTIYDKSKDCVPQSAMSGFDVKFNRLFYKGKKLVKTEPFTWSYNSLTPVVCGPEPKKD